VTAGCGVAFHRSGNQAPQLAGQGIAPQDQGEPMEIHLIIGAGIAAAAAITAILLRIQNDPLEEQIREALQYETKQSKMKKAIRS
jgi:hypothetical protein